LHGIVVNLLTGAFAPPRQRNGSARWRPSPRWRIWLVLGLVIAAPFWAERRADALT
jgi:hypothetical protein